MRCSLIVFISLALYGSVLGQPQGGSDVEEVPSDLDVESIIGDAYCKLPGVSEGATCTPPDPDPCIVNGKCQNKKCVGTPKCTTTNPCKVSTCHPLTGKCTETNGANGLACDTDANKCNGVGTCSSGTCNIGSPVTCTASTNPCKTNECVPSTGLCAETNKANGLACDTDANKCNGVGTCSSGTCNIGSPVTCTASTNPCKTNECVPSTGLCAATNKANGLACDTDANKCNGVGTCSSGTCNIGSPVVCTPNKPCHKAGTCAPATGLCSNGGLKAGYAECKGKCVKKCAYSRYLDSRPGKGCSGKCVACRGYNETKCGAYCCSGKGNKCVNGKCSK